MGFLVMPAGGGGGPAPNLIFDSRWTNGTGLGNTAVGDGGLWAVNQGVAGDQLEVISASGLGFPAGIVNVLRVRQEGESDFCDVQASGLPQPGAGSDRFYRLYTRWDEGNQPAYDHGIEPIPGGCAVDWAIKRQPRAGGVHHYHQFGSTPSDPYYGLITSGGADILLSKTLAYRYEWHFHFLSTTTFKIGDIRIYDAAGSLLYDRTNFYHLDFPGNASWRLDVRDPTFTIGATCLQNFLLGNNGQSGWTATETYTYHAHFAISDEDWVGTN